MPTVAQKLKASGNLTAIKLDELNSAAPALANLDFVAENNFCGHPHNVDDEIADSDPDTVAEALDMPREYCVYLIRGMRMMREAATGSGSYPPNCNPEYPGLHSTAYFDDPESRPPHLRRKMKESEFQSIIDARVWGPSGDWNQRPFNMSELVSTWGDSEMGDVVNVLCEEMYRRIGLIHYQVTTGESGQHNIHVSYPRINGYIGLGYFPGSNPCPGDHVNLHIAKNYTSGFQGQFGLKGHEFGHTAKGPHQFTTQGSHQEPLSYSYSNHLCVGYSTGESVFGLPRSPSMSLWERYYGGVPVGVPWKGRFENVTPTDPTEPTEPETISGVPNGVLVWEGSVRKILIQ